MDFAQIAEETTVILGCLTLICGLIYWALRAKLTEDFKDMFVEKSYCENSHDLINTETREYRESIKNDIKDIKELVVEIRKIVFDFIMKDKK